MSFSLAGQPAVNGFSSGSSPCTELITTCDRPRPSHIVDDLLTNDAPVFRPPSAGVGNETRNQKHAGLPVAPVEAPRAVPVYETSPPRLRPIPQRLPHKTGTILQIWQAATKTRLPARGARQSLLTHRHPRLSGFQKEVLRVLQGPIDAEALREQYKWTVLDAEGAFPAQLRLRAVPRNPLDKLLCESLVVRLDRHWRLVSVAFRPRQAERRTVVLRHHNWKRSRKGIVVTAAYHPSPSRPERTQTANAVPTMPVGSPKSGPALLRPVPAPSLPIAPTPSLE